MANLDTREWLLTNGLGSFASGTVFDVRRRTYHGWLFAATNPPSGRTLLLSHLEASLEIPGRVVALGTNIWDGGEIKPKGYELQRSFEINPVPKWIWGEDSWQLSRQLLMPHGGEKSREDRASTDSHLSQRILIHYRYDGAETAILRLRLLICDRHFHHQQTAAGLQFSQLLGEQQVCLQAIAAGRFGTPWYLRWTEGKYQPDAFWYWNYVLPEETNRGLGNHEDLYSPGYLTVTLQPGDAVTLEARVGFPDPHLLVPQNFAEALEAEQERLYQIFGWTQRLQGAREPGERENFIPPTAGYQDLLKASDQFIVYRPAIQSHTLIAGYHWFDDRGRDTLIALPGIALVTQRYDLAKELLQTFGRYCRHGLIPNGFSNVDGEAYYNSIDTALWWIETIGLYLEATQDWEFLAEQFPVVQQIHKAFVGGTRYNIQVDATDGLVGWYAPGVALTWMDAVVNNQPVTPRYGKPVEINALWYSALCWMSVWAERLSELEIGDATRLAKQAQRYKQQAQQVKVALQKFWNPLLGYLYDTIEPDDRRNAQIRPNAILAISLHHCGFSQAQGSQVMDLATYDLLTPYGLRTLNTTDPEYVGKYIGNPQQRDYAYHQGTVWGWLIGPFIRGWQRFYPKKPLPFNSQPLIDHFLADACLHSISEIFDGDLPHTPRGAIAQALSVAEVMRHIQDF